MACDFTRFCPLVFWYKKVATPVIIYVLILASVHKNAGPTFCDVGPVFVTLCFFVLASAFI